jgi:DNA-binding NarL/FixJ family response regulator
MNADIHPPGSNRPARILIVDDHAIVRYGMGVMLSGADDLVLCGEAETIGEALKAVQELKPDAAVVDIVLKDESGLDLIRGIRAEENNRQKTKDGEQRSGVKTQNPPDSHTPLLPHSVTPTPPRPLPILVMSMHNESTHAEKALRAGAQGYIMKENADEVLIDALRTVLAGKLYVSDGVHEKMLRTYIDGDEEETAGVESLTDREKEIFELIGHGLTTREIADKLGGSPRTVEVHRANIKKKLNCDTAAQVVRSAVQWVEKN